MYETPIFKQLIVIHTFKLIFKAIRVADFTFILAEATAAAPAS